MRTIYENTVKEIGSAADEFGQEMIIFFGDNAPDELKDYCYTLDLNEVNGDINPGDLIEIDGAQAKILAVGDEAVNNLRNLAHLTVNLSGNTEDLLPGAIITENVSLPQMTVGSEVRILGAK